MTTLTREQVRKLITYDPKTGLCYWRARSVDMFTAGKHSAEHQCNWWNNRFAGKLAGHFNDGYFKIKIFGKNYLAHRIIFLYMMGYWPSNDLDHWDVDTENNRWLNLRDATRSQNRANTHAPITNTSGVKGVTALRDRFRATIQKDGKKIHIGVFDTKELAGAAYTKKAIELHGEFARS